MEYLYNVKESGKRIKEFESIKERGVITPATVRQKENGRYESESVSLPDLKDSFVKEKGVVL